MYDINIAALPDNNVHAGKPAPLTAASNYMLPDREDVYNEALTLLCYKPAQYIVLCSAMNDKAPVVANRLCKQELNETMLPAPGTLYCAGAMLKGYKQPLVAYMYAVCTVNPML